MTFAWPNGARCACIVSFDFDAESGSLGRDPGNARRLVTLSYGRYGAKVGVPKVLELLDQVGLKSTFFVPGWTAENHRGPSEAILKAGHEIAHHGYLHKKPDPDKIPEVVEEFEKGLESLKRTLGVRPLGYRAPSGEIVPELMELIQKNGLLYVSSFKDDIVPYRHVLEGGRPGPIELPTNYSLDDWHYGRTDLTSPRPLFTREHVLSIWQDEFEMTYEWGGIFILILHPQVSGRPVRLKTLREFIAFTRRFPRVWYPTCADAARHVERVERAGGLAQAAE